MADPGGKGTPLGFGRVYAENKAAVIRVKSRPEGPLTTGVVIGAGGEVVFAAPKGPAGSPSAVIDGGPPLPGELLGYDRGLALAVARFPGLSRNVRPLQVAAASELHADRWVVTMRFDPKGRLEPFAGVVEPRPEGKGIKVAVPGQPGSPILSAEGELLGLAEDAGERSCRVLPVEAFVPFLKVVVLGSPR